MRNDVIERLYMSKQSAEMVEAIAEIERLHKENSILRLGNEILNFALNALRHDLGVEPTISNYDALRIVSALQDGLAEHIGSRFL